MQREAEIKILGTYFSFFFYFLLPLYIYNKAQDFFFFLLSVLGTKIAANHAQRAIVNGYAM